MRLLHILFYRLDCLKLIRRFIKNKRGLKFAHENRVRLKSKSRLHLALCINLDEIYCNIPQLLAHLILFGRPFGTSKF